MSEPILKHSRMPRKYEPKEGMPKPSGSENYGNLANVDPTEVLKRYLSDESTGDIAKSYSVSRQALGAFLLSNAEEEWKAAQVARAIARKEAAEDAMEAAQDPLALAKGRELFKAASWELERTLRRIYGEDRPVEAQINPVLSIVISNGNEEQKQPRIMQVAVAHPRVLESDTSGIAATHQDEQSST